MQGWVGVAGRGTNEATLSEGVAVGGGREYTYQGGGAPALHIHALYFPHFSINLPHYNIHSLARRTVPSTWRTLIGWSCIRVHIGVIHCFRGEECVGYITCVGYDVLHLKIKFVQESFIAETEHADKNAPKH